VPVGRVSKDGKTGIERLVASGLMLELHRRPRVMDDRGNHGPDLRDGLVRSEQTGVLARLTFHDDDFGKAACNEQAVSQLRCELMRLPIALERAPVKLEKVNAAAVREADRVV
jgi:hypothetical protein